MRSKKIEHGGLRGSSASAGLAQCSPLFPFGFRFSILWLFCPPPPFRSGADISFSRLDSSETWFIYSVIYLRQIYSLDRNALSEAGASCLGSRNAERDLSAKRRLRRTFLAFRGSPRLSVCPFSDASSHLYKRVYPSVGPSVGRSLRRSVRG